MLRSVLYACVVSAFLIGCWNDPKNTYLPTDQEKWEEIKPQIDKLKISEKEMLGRFMARHILSQAFGAGGQIEKDMTIGTAIEKQFEFEKLHKEKEKKLKL